MEVVAAAKPVTKRNAQDDYSLIQAAVQGDQLAFTCLMNRYRDSIQRTISKMVNNQEDVADLTQEAFGKAFHNLGSYRPKYAFSTWLFRIAINNCIDHIRKKRLHFLSIDEPVEADSDQDFSKNIKASCLNPEEVFIKEQRKELMHAVLERLTEKYRLMIELRYFEELSYEEISVELNMPIGTVKAQLHRAREAMYDLLRRPGASAYLETVTRKK